MTTITSKDMTSNGPIPGFNLPPQVHIPRAPKNMRAEMARARACLEAFTRANGHVREIDDAMAHIDAGEVKRAIGRLRVVAFKTSHVDNAIVILGGAL